MFRVKYWRFHTLIINNIHAQYMKTFKYGHKQVVQLKIGESMNLMSDKNLSLLPKIYFEHHHHISAVFSYFFFQYQFSILNRIEGIQTYS